MEKDLHVAFVGNPNCGKTSLFNAYTGAKLKVANWPGVTVEKKEGALAYHDNVFKLVDLPGTYSLTCYTMEETLTRRYILDDDVDVIVDVADASHLERNLYLTLQLIELGKPVVLALNMMDIVSERGMEIDMHRLPEMLGIPVIPVSARKKTGLDILMHAVAHHKGNQKPVTEHQHTQSGKHSEYVMVYSDEVEDVIDTVGAVVKKSRPEIKNPRWYAIKILEGDGEITAEFADALSGIPYTGYEKRMINEKYAFIEEIMDEVMVGKSKKEESTDRIDKYLTGKWTGLPIFFGIMALVFILTFTVGDAIKAWFEYGLSLISAVAESILNSLGAGEMVKSLVLSGIIAGVGGILTFLPNIFILFLALAILEDSGYMARVAYVMDSVMGKIGLSGRAFIPMLLGFGCSVPAVMASRALEDESDKLRTILVTPFMSCSARLPIYVIFSELFFPEHAALCALSMYIIGIVVAVFIAFLLGKVKRGAKVGMLLIELPEYKRPNGRTIWIYVTEKIKDYLTKAGTTIFIASVIVWVVLNFGPGGYTGGDMSKSFGRYIGELLTGVLKPAGLGYWQIVVALISGIAAKEVVVTSIGVLCGGNVYSVLTSLGFTSVSAYAFMVFCLLYVPCVATIATIKNETKSAKYAAFAVVMQLMTAYIAAVIVYNVGNLIVK